MAETGGLAGRQVQQAPDLPASDRPVSDRPVSGRLLSGRLVSGRLVSGRLVSGRLVSGRLVSGRSVRLARRLRELALARDGRWLRVGALAVGVAALLAYLLPGLPAPGAHWPMWDVRVYWWGGQQVARGGDLYAPGSRFSFTYPPFAAMVFALAAGASIGFLKLAITAASVVALAVLCRQSLTAAGLRRRPETWFALTALALLTWPVAYTLHLGEINLILAALIGADMLRRHDGGWWQGTGVGLAAGIKLTPLIFVAYLLLTRRYRAAATAIATFAATVAVGFALLPSQSTTFWLDGVFYNQSRVGNTANPSNQSLAGAVARLAGSTAAATAGSRPWWVVAVLVTSMAGIAIAAWAYRRGRRLAGVICCALTGLLISPISWTHHWVWGIPLLVALTAAAWRRRSIGLGVAAAAVAVVFCGQIPMLWPGHPPSAGRLVTGDLYVLCALVVLAGTALTLALERSSHGEKAQPPAQKDWAL